MLHCNPASMGYLWCLSIVKFSGTIKLMVMILATDIDMTLVGDDESLVKLNQVITRLRAEKSLKLVYVTGRSRTSFRELEQEKGLLHPDMLITAVGTEMHDLGGNHVNSWPRVDGWDRDEIQRRLDYIPELSKQPDSEQSEYKVSYYLENNPDINQRVHDTLSDLDVDIIYSMDKYLDILPRGINKGAALLHLANLWGVQETDIYTCGDSENDLALLMVGNPIVVGNANPSLRQWAMQSGNKRTYLASTDCAAGIYEGLAHFGVL